MMIGAFLLRECGGLAVAVADELDSRQKKREKARGKAAHREHQG